jgi:hypothetical protein
MFGINQLGLLPPPRWGEQRAAGHAAEKPAALGEVAAGVSVSTGLLTLLVIGGIAYLIWK